MSGTVLGTVQNLCTSVKSTALIIYMAGPVVVALIVVRSLKLSARHFRCQIRPSLRYAVPSEPSKGDLRHHSNGYPHGKLDEWSLQSKRHPYPLSADRRVQAPAGSTPWIDRERSLLEPFGTRS
jgi:hypothetical protein